LWNDSAFAKKQEAETSRIANDIGRYFTGAILLIGLGALAYWLPRDLGRAVNAFTAVLIVACPCAVALAIPFIFGNVLRHLGKHRFYLKNIQVIEALRKIDTVVVDKTGTITTRQKGDFQFRGQPLDQDEESILLAMVSQSSHPVSQLLRSRLESEGVVPFPVTAITEWEEIVGEGLRAKINGKEYQLGGRRMIQQALPFSETGEEGVWFQADGQIRGAFIFTQYLRPGTREVLDAFRAMGETHLLSGDNERERTLLSPLFAGQANMHFRKSPGDKLHFIKDLQEGQQARVLMFGDGLNDAGALRQSDVGIALAEDTANFTPASDGILDAASYPILPRLLAFARSSVSLVFGAYGIAFVYNLIGLSYAVQGALSPLVAAVLMPLSSITTVLFGLLGSNLLARRNGL